MKKKEKKTGAKKQTKKQNPESKPAVFHEEGGNRKGRGAEGAEKELEEIIGPEQANILIDSIRTSALLDVLGRCAAVVQRDIRAVRKRNPVTAELIELLVSDPAGFTFAEGAKVAGVSQQTARVSLWRASKRIPWLATLLSERMRLDMARGTTPHNGSF